MKKTDYPVVIVNGDNNDVKVSLTINQKPSKFAFAVIVFIALAILAVSFYCPDLLADLVRWIISIAIGS